MRAFARSGSRPYRGVDRNRPSARGVARIGELGAFGMTVPDEHGGAGLDYVSLAWPWRRSQPATAPPPHHQRAELRGLRAILAFGDEAQKSAT